jgi:hypothetical protein
MLPAHLVTTHGAPAHPHPVLGHLRSWQLGEFRRRDEVDALLCQQPATGRAPIERHRHLHGGLGEGLRRRGFTVTKRARARLASRRLGVGHPRAPGKWSGLSLPATFELFDLHTQGLVAGAPLGDLALQRNHQRQQLLTTQRGKVFGLTYGRHYKPFV